MVEWKEKFNTVLAHLLRRTKVVKRELNKCPNMRKYWNADRWVYNTKQQMWIEQFDCYHVSLLGRDNSWVLYDCMDTAEQMPGCRTCVQLRKFNPTTRVQPVRQCRKRNRE